MTETPFLPVRDLVRRYGLPLRVQPWALFLPPRTLTGTKLNEESATIYSGRRTRGDGVTIDHSTEQKTLAKALLD